MLLLLEQDEDTGQFPPSDLYFALRLAVPFTTEQLAHSLQALLALTTVTRPLATPMALREWRSACAQCEDLLYRHASHKGLEAQMDRVKGYMLLQAGERVQAAQHYAICTTEHDAWWPRQGLNQALLGLNRVESAHKDLAATGSDCPRHPSGAGSRLPTARGAVGSGLGNLVRLAAPLPLAAAVAPGGHFAGLAAKG
ncbi:hypothetical protein ACSZNR_04915 [Aeromonas caviae]